MILRKRKKMGQKELAEQIGVNQSNIPNYENGAYKPSADIILKIADLFKVPLDFLIRT